MSFFEDEPAKSKNSDDAILHGIGVIAGIGVATLVALSFAPIFLFAVLIIAATIWTKKEQWLNYMLYISIPVLIVLLLLGTWREIFQFASFPFQLFHLEQAIPYLEEYINRGQPFYPTVLTFVYFVLFAVMIARMGVYFQQRFQSRIVHSRKVKKEKEKQTRQYQSVQNNWMKINKKVQKAWRQKQRKKEKIDEVLLGIDDMGEPIKISYKEPKQHVLAQGTTGSGKTTALYSLLETALQNKDGFVMIDGKGDPDTIKQVQSLYDAYGRRLHVFHSSRRLTYNPFKNGGYTAGTNHLFNAFDWSEQFYKNVTKEHTQNVMAFLDAYEMPRDLKRIGKYLELESIFDVLKRDTVTYQKTEMQRVPIERPAAEGDMLHIDQQGMEYEEKEVTVSYQELSERAQKFMNLFFGRDHINEDEFQDIIRNTNGDLKKFIRGMSSQLNYIVQSEIGHLFEEKEDGIDLADVFAKGEGVIFSLNSMSYKDFILRLGRFIIDDVATIIQEQGQKEKKDVLGIFDEFDSYGNELITDILAKSRSANFRAVISVQSLAQLQLPEGDITKKVVDTCNTYLFGLTNDPDNAEYAANVIGTYEDEDATYMTKEIGPGLGRLDYKSDFGTVRSVRNYHFHPDQFKDLQQGEFIIRRKAAKNVRDEEKRAFVYFRNPIIGLENKKPEVN